MMKKILITGFSGFVASYFLDYLYENHLDYEIIGMDIRKPIYDLNKYANAFPIQFYEIDLLDVAKLVSVFGSVKPDYVLHLAAYSSVAYSWKHPEESFINNCNVFLNVVDMIKRFSPDCRILSVGSSEEYGNVKHEDLPVRENQELNPLSPYAVARVSQEQLSKLYADSFEVKIIMTRSFNHIGPRQDDRFVIPSFIKRIISIKNNGQKQGEIETGDLSIIRDFVDVRDVVDAYYKLLISGTVGGIYNVCSGKGIILKDAVRIIASEVGVDVKTKTNSLFIRPNDNMEMVGTSYKLETELGWKRKWSFEESIKDMIKYQLENNEKIL